mgnify:FL=1
MWVVKTLLFLCLLIGLVFPDLPGVIGKGWSERAIGYPISALIVPLIWYLSGKKKTYPHLADGLLVTPFVLDLGGNLVDFYTRFQNFDDVLHFVNWVFLVASLIFFFAESGLPKWNLRLLGLGFGATAIILWEGVEWIIQEMGTTGLQLTYDDTISDLLLSTSGGALGALIATHFISRSVTLLDKPN